MPEKQSISLFWPLLNFLKITGTGIYNQFLQKKMSLFKTGSVP